MIDVRFYHLQKKTAAQALPEILAKALARGLRVVIKVADESQLAEIDAGLWVEDPPGFLPHGHAATGNPAEQPIWLTLGDDNPNGATMLVLVDGVAGPPVLDGYDMCCEVFDDSNDAVVSTARLRWQAYKAQGLAPVYFQQDFSGRWGKK